MKAISWPTRDRSCKRGGGQTTIRVFRELIILIRVYAAQFALAWGVEVLTNRVAKNALDGHSASKTRHFCQLLWGLCGCLCRKFGCWSSHAPHVAPADYNISPRAQRRHVGTTGRGGGARDALRCPEMS